METGTGLPNGGTEGCVLNCPDNDIIAYDYTTAILVGIVGYVLLRVIK